MSSLTQLELASLVPGDVLFWLQAPNYAARVIVPLGGLPEMNFVQRLRMGFRISPIWGYEPLVRVYPIEIIFNRSRAQGLGINYGQVIEAQRHELWFLKPDDWWDRLEGRRRPSKIGSE